MADHVFGPEVNMKALRSVLSAFYQQATTWEKQRPRLWALLKPAASPDCTATACGQTEAYVRDAIIPALYDRHIRVEEAIEEISDAFVRQRIVNA